MSIRTFAEPCQRPGRIAPKRTTTTPTMRSTTRLRAKGMTMSRTSHAAEERDTMAPLVSVCQDVRGSDCARIDVKRPARPGSLVHPTPRFYTSRGRKYTAPFELAHTSQHRYGHNSISTNDATRRD